MRISEEEIRKLTLEAMSELGERATPELVKKVVEKSVAKIGSAPGKIQSDTFDSGRIILTAFGLDHAGIIAKITQAIADAECDIRDMSQKILDVFFTLIMIIDISNSPKDLKEIQTDMNKIAEEMNIKVFMQHEDLFRFMHRI
ncbi:MAG: ACT domain-containing protein [Bacteroidetes bacterium]|nr:ACT domain-containing protein [Bacteroidota bacterium]MBU1677831.1 ACT domain-containing protein [Bacteroidota bacterium]MBU2508074.1 ACT domain-containing protein [Bacteroidota bacterium]